MPSSVEQYQWIVSWLEKHQLYKTLDTLLDEGSEIASESFSLSKAVKIEVRNVLILGLIPAEGLKVALSVSVDSSPPFSPIQRASYPLLSSLYHLRLT